MQEIIIDSSEHGRRLDKFLVSYFPGASYGFLQKMIRKKSITLNGSRTQSGITLKSGDIIRVFFSDETFNSFRSVAKFDTEFLNLKKYKGQGLKIVFSNGDFAVIDKPYGVLSQKSEANDISLNDMFISFLIQKGELTLEEFASFRPSVVNRLDRNTGGLIIAAKNRNAAKKLTDQIKKKEIERSYLFICAGNFDKEGVQRAGYKKDEKNNKAILNRLQGTESKSNIIETEFKYIAGNGKYSLVEARLRTGKSHQIRSHTSFLGFPILGDKKYGGSLYSNSVKKRLPGQYLFAYKLFIPGFDLLTIDIPEEFKDILSNEDISYGHMVFQGS